MSWRGVSYAQFIFLGNVRPKPIYSWDVWRPLAERIGESFQTARGPASLRVLQYDRIERKEVKFGKLGWKADSFEKWTHGSRLTLANSPRWAFSGTEIWAPSPSQCAKDDIPPDAYFSIWTDPFSTEPRLEGLAVALLARRLDVAQKPLAAEHIGLIASSMNAAIVGHRTSNWVWRFFEGGMPVSLNDYLSMCLPTAKWAENGISLGAFDRREGWEPF